MKKHIAVFATAILFVANLQTALGASPTDEAGVPGSIHVVLGADKVLHYYFVPQTAAALRKYLRANATAKKQVLPAIDLMSLKTDKAATYKVLSESGDLAGYWVGPDTGALPAPLGQSGSTSWTAEKVSTFNPEHVASRLVAFPIPESEVMDSLRKQLLARAKELACHSVIRPREIAVTASLEASVGFIVGGSGTISFELTWDTDRLCS